MMSNKTLGLDDRLYAYLLEVSLREPPVLARLREETLRLPEARMQIAPEQGQLMRWLIAALGVRRVLEVGTFTGYSALSMALALPPEGRMVCCDLSEAWTGIARRYWREAGVEERIDLRLGPATGTLAELIKDGLESTFDFMFIDADKEAYIDYYELGLRLVRVGGVIAVDNTLWYGRVADPEDQEPDTAAIRAFNRLLAADGRVELSLVPIGDGMTLCRRR
jgi:predicted O-methyltransferase YrrM